LKPGVLSHPSGANAQFHPRYLDFAGHYGFVPVACTVRRANEKGRVENAVGYVKGNFLSGLPNPILCRDQSRRHSMVAHRRQRTHSWRNPPQTHRECSRRRKPASKPCPALAYDAAAIKAVTATSRLSCRL